MTQTLNRREFLTKTALAGVGIVLSGTSAWGKGKDPSHLEVQPKNNWTPHLNQFEDDFATTAVVIDNLWGGDHREPTGEAHLIVDCYCSGKENPTIAREDLRQEFVKDGLGISDKTKIHDFIKANRLEERMDRLRDYARNLIDRWRKESFTHLIEVLDVQLNLRLNQIGEGKPISDEQAYYTALGRSPKLFPIEETREMLIKNLAAADFPLTGSISLTELVNNWREKKVVSGEELYNQWKPNSQQLNQLTREKIFPFLPKWVGDIPEESVDFDIMREPVHYSGINLALHTIIDGKPVYHTKIRISNVVRQAPAEYKWGLVSHEGRPGHGLQIPVHHSLYARGEHGFETTMGLLCSPGVALDEGQASSSANLIFGSKLEGHLSPEELVAEAVDELNYMGRTNVVVKYVLGERDAAKLELAFHEDYCFSKENSHKYVNWLFHERMGKLMGLMYLPSYGVGRNVVRNAIENYGREAVIPVVYGTKGQVDVINFPERMKEEMRK